MNKIKKSIFFTFFFFFSRPIETTTSNNQQATAKSSNSNNNKFKLNKDLQTNESKNCANSRDNNDANVYDQDENHTIDLTKLPENSHTIDLTKSPDKSLNTSRKRSISPENEEIEEHSNKKRLANTQSD